MGELIGLDVTIFQCFQVFGLVVLVVGLFAIDYWLEKNP